MQIDKIEKREILGRDRREKGDRFLKILLDEMYTGLKEILESMGYEVLTVPEAGLAAKRDVDVVSFAKANGLVLITQDSLPAEIAEANQVRYVVVRPNDIATIIDQKLKKLEK